MKRYLNGVPRAILHYEYQKKSEAIVTRTDSDFAECEASRKSTSAGIFMWATHLIKRLSTDQAVIALSSGESEYYALVTAGRVSIGIKALAQKLGV